MTRMLISRINGSAIRNAMVDLRCISLCRLVRPSPVVMVLCGAAMSTMVRSPNRIVSRSGCGDAARERHPQPNCRCCRSVTHEAFDFTGRPVERLLQRLATAVADRHLGLNPLIVDLLGDLVWRRRGGNREG